MSTYLKIAAMLMGGAAGDAVGSPCEGDSQDDCLRYITTHFEKWSFFGVHRGPWPFGQITDDTQLTLGLVRSLLRCGGWSPEDFAHELVDLFSRDRVIGFGSGTREAVLRLEEGTPWSSAGNMGDGNGGAMRAAPIGVVAPDLATCCRWALEQAHITHASPTARTASAVVALAVALALEDTGEFRKHPVRLLLRIQEILDVEVPRNAQGAWPGKLEEMANLLAPIEGPFGGEVGVDAFRATGEWLLSLQSPSDWEGISPFAMTSVLWSLACVVTATIWDGAVPLAMSMGGDVDSTAAIAGSVVGALTGETPPKEIENLLVDYGDPIPWAKIAQDLFNLRTRLRASKELS